MIEASSLNSVLFIAAVNKKRPTTQWESILSVLLATCFVNVSPKSIQAIFQDEASCLPSTKVL